MDERTQTKQLADFFEDSFRALKPGRLNASILALCQDIAREQTRHAAQQEPVEAGHD